MCALLVPCAVCVCLSFVRVFVLRVCSLLAWSQDVRVAAVSGGGYGGAEGQRAWQRLAQRSVSVTPGEPLHATLHLGGQVSG